MLTKKIKILLSSEINKKIFSSSFWLLLGNVISKFTLLIATILMTKYMGKEEYGQFGIIKSTILMFVMFAGLELGMTATKYISQYKNIDKIKIERIIGVSHLFAICTSFIVSFFIFYFSDKIAKLMNSPSISEEIQMGAFILFFASINSIQGGILAGLENFKELSINSTLASVISSICLVYAAKNYDLKIVIIAFGLNFILLFIFNFLTLRKFFYNNYEVNVFRKSNFKEINVIWRFSLPAILAGTMVGPLTWLCNYLLVNQNNGYLEMADFDIANQWRNTILFIPSALAQIALPLLSSVIEDKKSYKKIFNVNLKINLYLGCILTISFILISPIIVNFYGKDYQNLLLPLIIMFITTGFITVNNVIGQAIASQDKMWLGFIINLQWGLVLLVCCYLFVVKFQMGAIGLSLAYLISYIFHTLVQFLIVRRTL